MDEFSVQRQQVEVNAHYRKMVHTLSSLGYSRIADALLEISNRLKDDARGNLKENKEVADYLRDAIVHLDLAANDLVLASKKLKK
jgi:hypothetical protein